MPQNRKDKKTRMIRTIIYYANFVVMGCMVAGLSPTLPTLLDKVGVSVAVMGTMFSARSIGSFLGSLLSGWAYDKFQGHRVLSVGMLLGALGLTIFSSLDSFVSILVVVFFLGMSHGSTDVGSNTMLIWTHGDEVGPWLNGLHAFYGVGTFIAPLAVTRALNLTGDFAAAFRIFAIGFLVLILIENILSAPTIEESQVKDEVSDEVVVKPVQWHILLACIVIASLYCGAANAFDGWFYTFLRSKGVSELRAGGVSSSFWGAFTVSRLSFIFLTRIIKERHIVWGSVIGWVLAPILGFVFRDSVGMMQVSVILLGASMAPLYATLMTIVKKNMDMTGKTTSLFPVGNAVGMTIVPFLAGVLFEYTGGASIFLVVSVTGVLAMGVAFYLRPHMVFEN